MNETYTSKAEAMILKPSDQNILIIGKGNVLKII